LRAERVSDALELTILAAQKEPDDYAKLGRKLLARIAVEVKLKEGERGRLRRGYEVRFRELGKQRSRTFDRKADAEAFDAEARLKRQRGEAIRRPSESEPLDAAKGWKVRRRADGASENTLKANASIYNVWIAPHLGRAKLAELTVPVLDDWRDNMRAAGASVETQRQAARVLGMILGDAVRRGQLIANPTASLPRVQGHKRRAARRIGVEEVEKMRAYFLAAEDTRAAAAISVLAYVGLRPEEARALVPESFDGDAFELTEEQTKYKTPARRAPIPEPVIEEVAALDVPLLFVRSDGGQFTDTDYRNWRRRQFRAAASAAGLLEWDEDAERWIGDFRPYDSRHVAASLKVRAGEPLPDVAADLGHSFETLCRVYVGEIKAMRGQPTTPISEAISAARVRTKFGDKKKAAPTKRRKRSQTA
jgi:integrase